MFNIKTNAIREHDKNFTKECTLSIVVFKFLDTVQIIWAPTHPYIHLPQKKNSEI